MTSTDAIGRARTVRIANLLARMGIKLRRVGQELVGPCPKCGGDDRFAVNIRDNIWNCRQCKPETIAGDVIGFVQWYDKIGFAAAVAMLAGERRPATPPPAPVFDPLETFEPDTDTKSRIAAAMRWWNEAGPIAGSAGQLYFERARKIIGLPPDVHSVLRFHRRVPFGRDDDATIWRSCIIALFRDVVTNEPRGVHRIAVREDGQPDPIEVDGRLIHRKALGIKQGSAIKLWADETVHAGLIIGEGLENTLAAALHVKHAGATLQPAWSLIDAGNMRAFPVLAGIEHLTILADHDRVKISPQGKPYLPGQDAARACARRYAASGVDAEVLVPTLVGADFNDLIKQIRASTS
jgi:hypothetical protein